MLPLTGDVAARFEAGTDRSVGGGRAQHPLDRQGSRGPAADCQPLAASLCRPWPWGAARQAAARQAADVVGLYVAPPAKAIVLCVDEKPSIQALERAQGYLKLPNGRALTGQSHDYKRHGTTTLFAAL